MGAATVVALASVIGVTAITTDDSTVEVAKSYGQGDGLNRFIVSVNTETPTDAPGSLSASSDDFNAPVADAKALDVNLLNDAQAVLGSDGVISAGETATYYVSDKGAMVISGNGTGEIIALNTLAIRNGKIIEVSPETSEVLKSEETPAPETVSGSSSPEVKKITSLEMLENEKAKTVEVHESKVNADVLTSLENTEGVVSVQELYNGQVLVATSLTLAEVEALPGVTSIEESAELPVAYNTPYEPNDPMFKTYGWSLKNTGSNAYNQTAIAGVDVNAPAAWSVTQGQDTIIAVIDTGFDSDHPDLVGSLWNNPTEDCGTVDTNKNGKAGDCHGWNFYTNSSNIDNGSQGSHGTTVSGVAGARIDNNIGSAGLAPKTKIMPLVVGGGTSVNAVLAAEAIRYAVDNGATVINASFGGAFTGSAFTMLQDAVNYAESHDVLIVAAAGNDSGDRDASLSYPASFTNANVLTVGSTGASDVIAASSAYGQTNVDMFAPGELVYTTWNDGGFRLVSGTSIAAPHVAAAVALYKSANPSMSSLEIKNALMADSVKVDALKTKSVSGGRLTVGKLSNAGNPGNESLSYIFNSLNGVEGVIKPEVSFKTTAGQGVYAAKIGLAMKYENEIWAVSGQEINLDGQKVVTNDKGEAVFTLGDKTYLTGTVLNPEINLHAGEYGLIVQVYKNGEPLTRPYAAPMVVSKETTEPSNPGTDSPGTDNPGTDNPGTDNPGGGGTNPGTGNPGDGTPDPGDNPGTGNPDNPGDGGGNEPSNPGTGNPGDGTDNPGTDNPGTDNPGTDNPGGGTNPGTNNPGTDNPGTDNPGTNEPGTGNPSNPNPTPEPTTKPETPVTGDVKYYDEVGAFKVTSSTPVKVSASGGAKITVTGNALETGMSARIGAMTPVDVVTSSSSKLVFVVPKMVAGTFDVTIFKNGKMSVLPDALILTSDDPSVKPETPGADTPGGSNPGGGTNPGTTQPGTDPTPKPTDGNGNGGPTPKPEDPAPAPSTPNPNPGPSEQPGNPSTPTGPSATKTGPNGQKLVRNDSYSSLSGLWSLQCSDGCSGIQV